MSFVTVGRVSDFAPGTGTMVDVNGRHVALFRIGDEFYAASAYLSREPTLLGSLVGQDVAKAIVLLIVVVGTAVATVIGFR